MRNVLNCNYFFFLKQEYFALVDTVIYICYVMCIETKPKILEIKKTLYFLSLW